ncbi:MAG: tyrosine-type recombinase/integrase [Clostridia bacterium]
METIILKYKNYLIQEEKSQNTISKYIRDIKQFIEFLGENELSKAEVLLFKEHIIKKYAPTSTNSIIAAVNSFLEFVGCPNFRVKPLKIQRDLFSRPEKELSKREYERLIKTAEKKENFKLSLIIQTICSTGIRVSELEYITVSSLHTARVQVNSKGKNRVILLPRDLCKMLKKYCNEQGVTKGSVFVTKTGKSLNRSNIWKMMKSLCKEAKVLESKVFPHNLRHLFARTFYKIEKDISRLADILGHSSIDTTRIYTIETGLKHARQIDKMELISYRE